MVHSLGSLNFQFRAHGFRVDSSGREASLSEEDDKFRRFPSLIFRDIYIYIFIGDVYGYTGFCRTDKRRNLVSV